MYNEEQQFGPLKDNRRSRKKSSRQALIKTNARRFSVEPKAEGRPAAPAEEPEWLPAAEEPREERERASHDENTCIRLYFREIGRVQLLTPAQEIELAALIKQGDKRAREQMIKANLRLVVKIAMDYEGLGLPLLDLISEGNIGLMKAVERFDPAKGGKLSTYGSWWIKQSMRRAIANQTKIIRLPVHLLAKISNLRRTSLKLQEVLGREPSDEELAGELGISSRRVRQMHSVSRPTISLDAPMGNDDGATLSEVVEDDGAGTPFEHLDEKNSTVWMLEMLKTLDLRSMKILQARFGLDGGREKTLDEIGTQLGITRERVRQLQNSALEQLRGKMDEKSGARLDLVEA